MSKLSGWLDDVSVRRSATYDFVSADMDELYSFLNQTFVCGRVAHDKYLRIPSALLRINMTPCASGWTWQFVIFIRSMGSESFALAKSIKTLSINTQ